MYVVKIAKTLKNTRFVLSCTQTRKINCKLQDVLVNRQNRHKTMFFRLIYCLLLGMCLLPAMDTVLRSTDEAFDLVYLLALEPRRASLGSAPQGPETLALELPRPKTP
jgi:hypothetical protein